MTTDEALLKTKGYLIDLLPSEDYDEVEEIIKALEPKTGHWIHFASGDDCSECGWSTGKYIDPSKYCPNCGAKMIELAESEVKK